MKTNNFKLPLYILIIAIIQLIINSNSRLYLDLLGITIIILILSNNYSFKSLIIISLIADLIGHWYLGSHLITAICLTFISTTSTTNFFNISTFLHKCIILIFFTVIFFIILLMIDLLVHNTVISPVSLIIEVVIIAPLLLKFLEKILIKHTQDFIF